MKKLAILTFLYYLFFPTLLAQEIDNFFTEWELDFKKESSQYLFGNNVKLRDAPNFKSELIELVTIDKKVKILEKTEAKDIFKGVEHPWYKVQVGNKTGYILGALIAHHKISTSENKVDFYFHINPEYKDKSFSIGIKAYKGKELLNAFDFNPIGHRFSFKVSGNRGIHEISNIVMIDYISEACGVEGGITYLFWDNEQFIHVADLTQMGDGGVLHEHQEFIFPGDPEGRNNGKSEIIFKAEMGHEINEETQWYITNSQSRILKWDSRKKKIIPEDFHSFPKEN